MAPSDEDLNEPFPSGKTPYEYALEHKSVELIKILAPKVKNPNAPYSLNDYIPICRAIELGHNEIVEILAPLVENPNESNTGCTNICLATDQGNIEAVKILAPLVKNPNFCGYGLGKTDIKLLRSLLTSFFFSFSPGFTWNAWNIII